MSGGSLLGITYSKYKCPLQDMQSQKLNAKILRASLFKG